MKPQQFCACGAVAYERGKRWPVGHSRFLCMVQTGFCGCNRPDCALCKPIIGARSTHGVTTPSERREMSK